MFAAILVIGYLMGWLGMERLWGIGVANFVGGIVAFIVGIVMWIEFKISQISPDKPDTQSDSTAV